MFYIVCTIDAIVFGFILGTREDSFFIGLLVAILTLVLSACLYRPYQVFSAGVWGYLLYTWLSPEQPEFKIVVIITAVVLGRWLLAWLNFLFDDHSTGTPLPSTIPVEENDLSYSYPNGHSEIHQKDLYVGKKNTQSLNSGLLGEQETAYHLRFIRNEYKIFNGIYLRGGGETQEFDHLVVGPTGVFHIETKNYYGRVEFSDQGMRRIGGKVHEDPRSQMHRHDYVLKELLKGNGINTSVVGIICFTNPECVLIGSDPFFKIIKVGVLVNTIKGHTPNRQLTKEKINRIASLIESKCKSSNAYMKY
ncbi:nuclease-related domain-containing protein [Oceanobacillus salinisoli]|uniref:nuclease-related domain-containing protein n=1 Tax=Oceanobacillus salinisoli TaxID=2678611 RepID=UPI0012E1B795|nr:nuclease-related domain-containing protein [Oceanobacillus salinisoli]